jgi:hypothetical protein
VALKYFAYALCKRTFNVFLLNKHSRASTKKRSKIKMASFVFSEGQKQMHKVYILNGSITHVKASHVLMTWTLKMVSHLYSASAASP